MYVGEYMDFINDPGEEISNGDEGSEDAGHHRRRVHPLLASVLHNVLGARLLPQLYPPHCVQRTVLARLLQLRNKSVYLRAVQQGLPVRVQKYHLQVLLQTADEHFETRQRWKSISDQVSEKIDLFPISPIGYGKYDLTIDVIQ